MNKQKGFSIVELVLVLVLLGIIGVVGYRVWQAQNTPTVSSTATTKAKTAAVPAINKPADLSTADTALDQTDVGTGDLDSLNSQLQF